MTITEFCLRIAVALLLGALIGLERQWRQRLAGLRTNTLVATGAALFVALSMLVEEETSPTRVAGQVASGIGFLGAGVIFRQGATVRGLNTAATLWASAAVGVLAGTGFLIHAAVGAVAVLMANTLLRPVVDVINRQPLDDTELETRYRCELVIRPADEVAIRRLLLDTVMKEPLSLRALTSTDLEDEPLLKVVADLVATGRNDTAMERIVSALSRQSTVSSARWRISEEERWDPVVRPEAAEG